MLLELQEIDKDLRERKLKYAQIEKNLKQKAQSLQQKRKECEKAHKEQIEAELNLRKLELERASQNQARTEASDTLYRGSPSSTSQEIISLENRIGALDNRILQLEEQIDPLRKKSNEAKSKHKDLSADLAEMEKEWEQHKEDGFQQRSQMQQEYNEALKHREKTASAIPEEQLAQYTRLFNANRGRAVAIVSRDICNGCSERLPVSELTRLKHATEPIICHCGRYLITLDKG